MSIKRTPKPVEANCNDERIKVCVSQIGGPPIKQAPLTRLIRITGPALRARDVSKLAAGVSDEIANQLVEKSALFDSAGLSVYWAWHSASCVSDPGGVDRTARTDLDRMGHIRRSKQRKPNAFAPGFFV
jgi:hypothetical protein